MGIPGKIAGDIRAAHARDPAARSPLEVVFVSCGFHAVLWYRLAHPLWRARLRFVARCMMGVARWLTGVEIHPAAVIGQRFFIDHGMGVVIGETAEIGDDVTLYQGVTLGGISPAENSASQRGNKRHPTLGSRVIVGSGAQILGPVVVGDCARVGANSVVLKSVPEGATVVGIPARVLMTEPKSDRFDAYGTPRTDVPDPSERALDELRRVRSRLNDLESQITDQSRTQAEAKKTDILAR